jgi:GTPase SAR1 family protein
VKELRKMLSDDLQIAIAGNKCDMEKSRNVDRDEALAYCASVGASHHLTSAKSGAGINEAFTELMRSETNAAVRNCTLALGYSHALPPPHRPQELQAKRKVLLEVDLQAGQSLVAAMQAQRRD